MINVTIWAIGLTVWIGLVTMLVNFLKALPFGN